jgi:hypothetical protein
LHSGGKHHHHVAHAQAALTALLSGDLTGRGVRVQAAEGVPFKLVPVAVFNDPVGPNGLPAPASEFKATIDWGDGSPLDIGKIKQIGVTGTYVVLGSHTYPEDTVTPYPITVTITDPPESSTRPPAILILASAAVVAESPFGDNDLTGKGVPVQAAEGVPFRGMPVAMFHDPISHGGQPDPITEFKVTIDWGDGSPVSLGQVLAVGTNGDYLVLGSHTYPEDTVTPYPITVTISDPSDFPGVAPATLTLSSSAFVAESPFGDNDLTGKGVPVQAAEGVPFQAVPVATFNDPVSHGGAPDPVTEFKATIDWGDGSPVSVGQVQLLNAQGDYAVLGSHTYPEDTVTPYPITVTISDPSDFPGVAPVTLTLSSSAFVAEGPFGDNDLTGKGVPVQAAEGVPFQAVPVATFNDPVSHGGAPDPVTEFKATIDWGDGSPVSVGQVQLLNAQGDYAVFGSHTYPEDTVTPYPITVTISDPSDFPGVAPATLTLSSSAFVAEGPIGDNDLTGKGVPVQAEEGAAFQGVPVALFNDPVSHGGAPDVVGEFTVTIDWGDGSPVGVGQVQLLNAQGDYAVLGSHTYPEDTVTPYPITVTIIDAPENPTVPPATLVLATQAVVAEGPLGDADLTGKGLPVQAEENVPFTARVATFNDPVSHGGLPDPTTEFTVTIDWGDGSSSNGTVNDLGGGNYGVTGSHTYKEDGAYPVKITISDAGSPDVVVNTVANVADGPVGDDDLVVGTVTPVSVDEATPFTGTLVQFFDPPSGPPPGTTENDFAATIDWGDGSSSSGTVNDLGGGKYSVTGGHTYKEDGTYPVTITLSDPGSADVVLTTTANVADGPNGDDDLVLTATPTAIPLQEATPFSGTLLKFFDPPSGPPPGTTENDFTVTISWGDGSSSNGTVNDLGGGNYSLTGSHTYQEDGVYPVTINLSDPGSPDVVVTTIANVAEGPNGDNDMTGSGVPIVVPLGMPFTLPVAAFHDPVSPGGQADPGNSFTAIIDWGDGSPQDNGQVQLTSANGDYQVFGHHVYSQPSTAPFTITVTIVDPSEDPGVAAATLTLTTTATVGLP